MKLYRCLIAGVLAAGLISTGCEREEEVEFQAPPGADYQLEGEIEREIDPGEEVETEIEGTYEQGAIDREFEAETETEFEQDQLGEQEFGEAEQQPELGMQDQQAFGEPQEQEELGFGEPQEQNELEFGEQQEQEELGFGTEPEQEIEPAQEEPEGTAVLGESEEREQHQAIGAEVDDEFAAGVPEGSELAEGQVCPPGCVPAVPESEGELGAQEAVEPSQEEVDQPAQDSEPEPTQTEEAELRQDEPQQDDMGAAVPAEPIDEREYEVSEMETAEDIEPIDDPSEFQLSEEELAELEQPQPAEPVTEYERTEIEVTEVEPLPEPTVEDEGIDVWEVEEERETAVLGEEEVREQPIEPIEEPVTEPIDDEFATQDYDVDVQPMEEPDADLVSPMGMGFAVGGGVTGYPGEADDFTGTGGNWEARYIIGTRTFVGGELAYHGTANSLETLGVEDNAILMSNGAEGALRVNLGTENIQPYVLGGVGWKHFNVTNTDTNTSDIRSSDDALTVPVGAGLAYKINNIYVDARGMYRPAFLADITRGDGTDDTDLSTLSGGVNLGFEF